MEKKKLSLSSIFEYYYKNVEDKLFFFFFVLVNEP